MINLPKHQPEQEPVAELSLKSIFQRFRRNIAIIFGSRLIFGLMNLATNILIVRFFGVAELGIMVLLQGYARLCVGVMKPDTWQLILKYGTSPSSDAEKPEEKRRVRRLFGLCFLIDIVMFFVTISFAVLMLPLAANAFEWPDNVVQFAPYFMLSVVFITHSSVTGILRLYDRVDTLASQFAANALIRFIGALIAIALQGNVFHIVLAWFVASVVSGTWPIIIAYLELKRRKCTPIIWFSWQKASQLYPGFWRFVGMTHLTRQTSQIIKHGTALFIGAQMGTVAAGAYGISRQFAVAISKPSRMLGPLIFPEMAKLTVEKEWHSIRKLIMKLLRINLKLVAVIGFILMLSIPLLIDLLYGPELEEYAWLFRIHVLASLVGILGFTLEPFLLSANKPGTVLIITLFCLTIYLLVCGLLYSQLGLLAFAIGVLSFSVVRIGVSMGISMRLLGKRRRKSMQNS